MAHPPTHPFKKGEKMLALVKTALRITGNAFDTEIAMLIDAACLDLGIAGVTDGNYEVNAATTSSILKIAIITYVKAHFGNPENPELLMKSYNEQKAQLQVASGYTVWKE